MSRTRSGWLQRPRLPRPTVLPLPVPQIPIPHMAHPLKAFSNRAGQIFSTIAEFLTTFLRGLDSDRRRHKLRIRSVVSVAGR